MPQDKYIVITLKQLDGSYIEITGEGVNINSSVGSFHDCLIQMLDNANFSEITCILKDKTKLEKLESKGI